MLVEKLQRALLLSSLAFLAFIFVHPLFFFQGKTHVMVGIKAELGEPLNSHPDSAVLEFFVDW